MSVYMGFVLQLLPLGYLSTVPTHCLSARIVVTACTALHAPQRSSHTHIGST